MFFFFKQKTAYEIRRSDWSSDVCSSDLWFHRCLDREFARAGRADDVHGDDEIHDRYVGAAVEMIRGGQPHKGAVFYNRFADMAGYERVKILGTDPVVVDIRNAVLEVHGQNFFLVSSSGSSVH